MSDTPERTRSELLNELESIQGLLDDDEIPVLQEVIESLEKHHNSALGLHEVNYELDLGDSALTTDNEPAEKNTTSRAQHNTAQGENPFLPQHIRSRLRGNRAGDFATEASDLKNTARQQLIDEVINDLLPQLKATLHTKLSVLTDAQLQALNSKND